MDKTYDPGDKIKSVLIIDDEEDILDLLQEKLASYNVQIIRARNGNDAVFKVENQKFNLIITDLKMPGLDGFGFLKFKSKIKINASTPVIAISAFLDGNKLKELLTYKVFNIFSKPIDDEKFNQAVKKFLK